MRNYLPVLVGVGLSLLIFSSCGTGSIRSASSFPGSAIVLGREVSETVVNPTFYDFIYLADAEEFSQTTRVDFPEQAFDSEETVRISSRAFRDETSPDRLPEGAGEVVGLLNFSSPLDASFGSDLMARIRLSRQLAPGQRLRLWFFPLEGEAWEVTEAVATVDQSGSLARVALPTRGQEGINGLYGLFEGSLATTPLAPLELVRFELSATTVAPGEEVAITVELTDPGEGEPVVVMDDGTGPIHGLFSDISQQKEGSTVTHTATWQAPSRTGTYTITLRAINRSGSFISSSVEITVQ